MLNIAAITAQNLTMKTKIINNQMIAWELCRLGMNGSPQFNHAFVMMVKQGEEFYLQKFMQNKINIEEGNILIFVKSGVKFVDAEIELSLLLRPWDEFSDQVLKPIAELLRVDHKPEGYPEICKQIQGFCFPHALYQYTGTHE